MTIHKELHSDSDAKEVEGKVQAAVGEFTGDTGQKLKGEAKQMQAAAMKVGEHVVEPIKSLAEKVKDRGRIGGNQET